MICARKCGLLFIVLALLLPIQSHAQLGLEMNKALFLEQARLYQLRILSLAELIPESHYAEATPGGGDVTSLLSSINTGNRSLPYDLRVQSYKNRPRAMAPAVNKAVLLATLAESFQIAAQTVADVPAEDLDKRMFVDWHLVRRRDVLQTRINDWDLSLRRLVRYAQSAGFIAGGIQPGQPQLRHR